MAVLQEQELKTWIDRDLVDSEGDKIGKVEGLFYDETGRAEWLTVTTGLFGTKKVLVPASMVTTSGERLMATFNKDHIDQALKLDDDETPTEEQQRFLYRYWGLGYKPLGRRWSA